jgi:adenylate kinase
MNFCLIGAPGVGKGTFSKLLIQRLKLNHISVGDIVRREIGRKSAVGIQAQSYVTQGQLIPDEVVNGIVLQEVHKHSSSNILLDGFPRNVSQAEFLDHHLSDLTAVHIKLDKSVAVEKLLGRRVCSGCERSFNIADICRDGYVMPAILPADAATCPRGAERCAQLQVLEERSDDTRDTILTRFAVFDTETAPVIQYYGEKSRLKSFDVKRGVDDIDELIDVMIAPQKDH